MIAHMVLALTLPVAANLGVSHLFTWVILGSGLMLLWLSRQRSNTFSTGSWFPTQSFTFASKPKGFAQKLLEVLGN